jgi:protein tyrosine phosphatase (PTP) superfamily phosphohydrolase (DUF442 family)
VYQGYEARQKGRRLGGWTRWSLAALFLLCFGFAGGVLFLLVFMVPVERGLADRGLAQGLVDAVMAALVFGWVLVSLLATAIYGRLLLSQRRNLPLAVGALGLALASAFVIFYFLLDTDLMVAVGELNDQNVSTERLTFGAYPDEQRLEDLKAQGYDGVVTLLNPNIPFEKVLLEREKEAGEEVGIPVHSFPMLPWISSNDDAIRGIERLVGDGEKRYYIHCYLGKHRVDLVRQQVAPEGAATNEDEPLPDAFERGRLAVFDEEEVILGPYPTDEEWFEFVVRRDVKEVVSTLDPNNPADVPWIEKEREIAKENGMTFTLMPLNPNSPNPARVEELASYARSRDHKVYVHSFNVDKRFESLESALRRPATQDKRASAAGVSRG